MQPGNLARLVLLGLGALASLATSPAFTPPEPDSCEDLSQSTATVLTVGSGLGDVFAPWASGDPVTVTVGAQGGFMIAVKLRVEGEGSFACTAQRTEIRDAETMLGYIDVPLHFYEADGGWETRTNWVILTEEPAVGETLTVNARVGDQAVSVDLVVAGEGGAVLSIDPQTVTAGVGDVVRFRVGLQPPGYGGTVVTTTSSDLSVARPLADATTVPAGAGEVLLQVSAEGPGVATLTAAAGGTWVTATLTVEDRPLQITPGTLAVAAGGSAIVAIRATDTILAQGRTVTLTAGAAMAAPASVDFPVGADEVRVRVYAFTGSAGFVSALDAAHISGATAHADVSLTDGGSPPIAGELTVAEIAFDVEVDANCDGTSGGAGDQLVELVNTTNGARQLQDVAINTAILPSFVLGPGEAVVVFGSPLGSAGGRPWCTALTTTHLGDAAALSAGPLGLQGGTSLVVRRDATVLASDLLPVAVGASLERDASGTLIPHPSFPGAATDRLVTPGTLPSSRPFADY